MTQISPPPQNRRARIALAAISGLFAGAARALTDWLLGHLGG